MAMNGKFLRFCNVLGKYRNVFVNSQGYNYPLFQQTAGLRQKLEEKFNIPPKPKRPLTPYFRFMKKTRPDIVKENPNLKLTDVVREISVRWEKAEPQLKEKLELEYKKEHEVYTKERLEYDTNLTDEQKNALKQVRLQKQEAKEKRKIRKKCKENDRPKKPGSAFMQYFQTQLPTRGANQEFRAFQKQIVDKWQKLSEAEKKPLVDDVIEQMKKYQKLMTEWERKMIKLGNTDIVRNDALIEPHVKISRKKRE